MSQINTLDAISPIDGRYRGKVAELAQYFSEGGLIDHRLLMEIDYLDFLTYHEGVDVPPLSEEEAMFLRTLANNPLDPQTIKQIETKGIPGVFAATNHDVKSVEYFLAHRMTGTALEKYIPFIHFGLTSEDTTSVAISLMVMRAKNDIVIPAIEAVAKKLDTMAKASADIPMLARTHGQPATPTTVGKEFQNVAKRLEREISKLYDFAMPTKLNGASGNYNAHVAAYPDVDWPQFTVDFVKMLREKYDVKLEANLYTTQIESHDGLVELFDIMKRINVILTDFCADIWRYISDKWVIQKAVAGEIGSSTMPHKVNPIDFENAEGNLGIANALFAHFGTTLPISRLQRHLSDSTVLRNVGVAFAHSLIAFKSIVKGLGKISINDNLIVKVLAAHPEVITEAIQTIMRRYGVKNPYELLKDLSRGKSGLTMEDIHLFIDTIDIPEEAKEQMRLITPTNYVGLAPMLAIG